MTYSFMHRPTLLILLVCAQHFLFSQPQTYQYKTGYDSLGTRYDKSLPLIERYFITAGHGSACFNLGLKDEMRVITMEEFALA